jgi:hypothetical protein
MEELNELEHLFYSEEYFPSEEKKEENLIECNHEWRPMESHLTCIICGIVDIDRPIFIDDAKNFQKSTYLFARKTYFLTVLRLLSCSKPCDRTEYSDIVKQLSEHQFENIFELKKILTKLKFRKYYKYIYLIYFDIKKVKLIDLKYDDIEFLSKKFLFLELEFKKMYPNKSNMLSYSLISYCLLKRYNYDFYKYVIIPKKKDLLIEKINELLKNIDNY